MYVNVIIYIMYIFFFRKWKHIGGLGINYYQPSTIVLLGTDDCDLAVSYQRFLS